MERSGVGVVGVALARRIKGSSDVLDDLHVVGLEQVVLGHLDEHRSCYSNVSDVSEMNFFFSRFDKIIFSKISFF